MAGPPLPTDHESARTGYRVAAAGLLVAALAILFGVGHRPIGDRAADVAFPEAGETLPVLGGPEGILESPPTEYAWTPGGRGGYLAHFVVYDKDFRRVWTSGPLTTDHVEVPAEAYRGLEAGAPVYWRVREFARGRPWVASAVSEFYFRTDSDGFGPGENPNSSALLDD